MVINIELLELEQNPLSLLLLLYSSLAIASSLPSYLFILANLLHSYPQNEQRRRYCTWESCTLLPAFSYYFAVTRILIKENFPLLLTTDFKEFQ